MSEKNPKIYHKIQNKITWNTQIYSVANRKVKAEVDNYAMINRESQNVF